MTDNANTIISKQRVIDHGEVFTSEREVIAMLCLVEHETERIDSRFLEPACGTGNFLAPLLEKKLAVICSRYSKSQLEFERYTIAAVGSIYGVEIQADNVQRCRERLYDIFNSVYTKIFKKKGSDECRESVRFILNKNILWGDALTLKSVDDHAVPLVFSEWSIVQGSMIKRRDFAFAELLHDHEKDPTLFSQVITSDTGESLFHPRPVREYALSHYLTLRHESAN